MNLTDNKPFSDLLLGVFDVYNRQPPMAATQMLWFRMLERFDLAAITAAFGQYVSTEPKFPPTPAQILALLGQGAGDNRPGADEAWAMALTARDEAATVVWTAETAQAFAACRPVLDLGDEVGARMAFRQTYDRLVAASRARGVAPRWVASLGWDMQQREATLTCAAAAGLLPAPQVAALLPPPMPEDEFPDVDARQAIDRIRKLLANAVSPADKQRRAAEAERVRLEGLKADTAEKVRAYQESQG
jgi:hypothetical protein